MNMNRNRQPAGVPVGGQFASQTHAESGVSLADMPLADEPEHDVTEVVANPDVNWGDVTNVQEGSRTPWGTAQWVSHPAPGIVQASTGGHGGVKLSPERNRQIPPELRRKAGWYEEDCDAAIVGMYHPEAFPHLGDDYDHRASVKEWFPDDYETATGETVTADESYARGRTLWAEQMDGREVARSAISSDEHPGMVEVDVQVYEGGGHRTGGASRRILVPVDEYRDDTHKHPIGRYHGHFVVPEDADYTDITPPPAPPAPPKPVYRGIGAGGTERQQELVARDMQKRWRTSDGTIVTLREKAESDGFTHKSSMAKGNGRYTYYLVDAESHAFEVSKATWDAAEAPGPVY